MNIKIMLYIITIPTTMWVVTSLNLDRFFKKGSITQIKIFYFIMSLIISYLFVNFLYDFYSVFQIIK